MNGIEPTLSVIVPAYDEEESLGELVGELHAVLGVSGRAYEIVIVDDGSNDGTFAAARGLHERDERVRVVRLRTNFGKSVALTSGFRAARGQILVTLDADLQDDPREIPRLLDRLEAGSDLVCGWKRPRRDPLSKVLPSLVINWITSLFTGQRLHDMNCGLKAFRREAVDGLVLQGGQYRFLPALVGGLGFRVAEVAVSHRPRKHGRSKYGARRFVTGFLDLLTVLFLTRYGHKPLHVFGILGALQLAVGGAIVLGLLIVRLIHGSIMSRHPLLIGGVMLVVMGIQFISTGLLAEMLSLMVEQGRNPEVAIKERLG